MNAATITLIAALACVFAWAGTRAAKRLRKGGGCCGEHAAAEAAVPAADRRRGHYPYRAELAIGGMTCAACARRVENALNAAEGTWARVDLSTRRADVRLKEPPDEAALRRIVADAGYAVTAVRIPPRP